MTRIPSTLLKKPLKNLLRLLLVILFFALPILRLFWMSIQEEGHLSFIHYQAILTDPRTWEVLGNTLHLVFGSLILASLIGISLAWIVAYTDIRFKPVIQLLTFLPVVIPSYVASLAWVQFFRPKGLVSQLLSSLLVEPIKINLYSLGGIIFVMGLTTYPLVYLFTVNAFRRIPRDAELAARSSGASLWRVFSKITLPMALPGIMGGIFIAFLNCLDNFGIPAFLGTPAHITVLTTYIYQQVIGFGPTAFNRSAVLSVLLTLMALVVMAVQWLITRKSQVIETHQIDTRPRYSLGRSRWFIEPIVALFLLTTSIMPLISLVCSPLVKAVGLPFTWDNLSFKNYHFILSNPQTQQAILTSLKLAGLSALIILILGTLFAYKRTRENNRLNRYLEAMMTAPYALPGTVFALAMIFNWMQPLPGWNPGIYGSVWILYLAYVSRFMIIQVRSGVTAFNQIDRSVEEAGQVAGMTGWAKWRTLLIPLILPVVFNGTLLVFLQSLTELTLSSLLYSSQAKTIGVQVLSYQQAGYTLNATAFSSLIVGLIFLAYLVVFLLAGILRRKRWIQ